MKQDMRGMSIRIEKNSIKFFSECGNVYYKNFSKFIEALNKGQRVFNAPLSEDETSKSLEPILEVEANANL